MEQGDFNYSFLRASRGDFFGGTIPWMVPEQFDGEADLRADIYSFGIILYQMFNKGEFPFNCTTEDDYENAHKFEPIIRLNNIAFPIIEKCLKKDPNERYQTFNDFSKDLEDLYLKSTKNIFPKSFKEKELSKLEHYDKGMSFKVLGFLEDALQEFNYVIRENPIMEKAYIQVGLIYKSKDLIDKSIAAYNRVLQINPNSVIAKEELNTLLKIKNLNFEFDNKE